MPSERVRKRIEALLDEADAALARNDWRTALERAKAALAHDPENEDAKHYREAAERGLAEHPVLSHVPELSEVQQPPRVPVQSAQALPSSFASGRYVVRKFLGEGGKKKVFLAHDTTLDRDVAFALIKAEGLDDAARRRIVREAQAMGRLGDHPNIQPIFDQGTENGQPYMVLPLMQGGDVAELIEKARDHRPPLEQVLRVTKDVCEGLAFAHSKGIVHRDLKPGNVWLTERGQAKIGDFGLALPLEQSRLTREGFMVGTVAYMPPEQAMGGEITPRADLYSLGAMLYEMVTGRPPFLGDDEIAIIGQHINTPPVAPTWHNQQCPKPLEALIMRLLAKDPVQRPESVGDVLSALIAIETSSAAQRSDRDSPSVSGATSADAGRSLDSMSSGVFVGRHKEMDLLRAALEEALSGRGRMVTLVGEPGIGKTRTSQELATYAGLRRCQVLWGRCYEGGGAPPYWPWVQAIRQYVQERDAESLRGEMGSTASVIAELVSDVGEKLPGVKPPPPLESPESARFRLFDSIASFLKNASRTRPLLLVLDDLHWSDKPSLLLLEFVARELANSRILLIGTYRDVELNRRHPLAVTLGDLTKDRLFERVLLRGLQKPDVERFIELAAGTKPPQGLVDAVFAQTEGNPLFVTEVVRLLVQEGHIAGGRGGSTEPGAGQARETRGRKAGTWTVRIPEGVREVIGRRLDRLTERCNEVLTTASVIGRQFSLQQLLAVLNDPSAPADDRTSEDRLFEVLEEALGARVIEEIPDAVARYQFTHALIQETLLNELSTTRRVRLHARIGLALERLYGPKAGEHASELFAHFAEAEAVAGAGKLIQYSIDAAGQALSRFAYEEALARFQRGLAACDETTEPLSHARLLDGVGRSQMAILPRGRRQEAVEALRRAVRAYLKIGRGDDALSIGEIQMVAVRGGANGGGTDITTLIEEVMPAAAVGSAERGMLLCKLAEALVVERNDFPDSRRALDEAYEITKQRQDSRLELYCDLAALLVQIQALERTGGLRANAERTVRRAAAGGELRVELRAQFWLVGTSMLTGDLENADAEAREMLRKAEQRRDMNDLGQALGWMTIIGLASGRWDDSRAYLARLAATGADQFGMEAYLEFQVGRLEAADRGLEQLVQAFQGSPRGPSDSCGMTAMIVPLMALLTGDRSRLGVGKDAVEILLTSPLATPAIRAPGRFGESLIAVLDDDKALARMCLERRRPEAIVAINGPTFSNSRLIALLAETCGDYELAEKEYVQAIAFLGGRGFRPELAWTLYHHAVFLDEHAEPRDPRRSAQNLDRALGIANELGIKPLIERIIARKKILKA